MKIELAVMSVLALGALGCAENDQSMVITLFAHIDKAAPAGADLKSWRY